MRVLLPHSLTERQSRGPSTPNASSFPGQGGIVTATAISFSTARNWK